MFASVRAMCSFASAIHQEVPAMPFLQPSRKFMSRDGQSDTEMIKHLEATRHSRRDTGSIPTEVDAFGAEHVPV